MRELISLLCYHHVIITVKDIAAIIKPENIDQWLRVVVCDVECLLIPIVVSR